MGGGFKVVLPRQYSTREVADYFCVGVETVRRWHRAGKLPGTRLGKSPQSKLVFTKADIQTYLNNHGVLSGIRKGDG